MSPFLPFDAAHDPIDSAVLQRAYDDACRKLGLDAAECPRSELCNRLAIAIMAAARMGERDPGALSEFAIKFGTQWQPPRQESAASRARPVPSVR